MLKIKAPWWMYVVACSYAAYFCVIAYMAFWGPEWVGLTAIQDGDRVVIKAVLSDSPASRAGLRRGDQILAAGGHSVHALWDWYAITFNVYVTDSLPIRFVRDGDEVDGTLVIARRNWRSPQTVGGLAFFGMQIAYLAMAFLIAFGRPFNIHARLGALFLASAVTPMMFFDGLGVVFRQLPGPAQALLWVQCIAGRFGMAAFFAFCATFPKPPFRARWLLPLFLAPIIALVPFEILHIYRFIYLPNAPSATPAWIAPLIGIFWLTYLPAGFGMLLLNYHRSRDATERRRIRVLILGTAFVAFVSVPLMVASAPFGPRRFPALVSPLIASISALALPASFAYAILRHRLFDIRVIIRQGLQYAIARKTLLFISPALLAALVIDVLLRGDETLAQIVRERGWMYASLAALTMWLHLRRVQWLRALDRRFFREQYNAQQVLGATVREVRTAQTAERVAPRIIAQIELALHPTSAGIFRLYNGEPGYRLVAASDMPAGILPAGARLCRILHALGKPLEIGDTRNSLRNSLPEDEIAFLRDINVEWLFPVHASAEQCVAFLAIGPKRSGQPYIREDIELVQSIADSLGLLFERDRELECDEDCLECPACGRCYESGGDRCGVDSDILVRSAAPRVIQGRFRLERRIGQGGMGIVYDATDLELDRRVAIKFLGDRRLGDASGQSRFRREARVLATFQHPNVVTIFDAGWTANGRGFLVMELLRGASLRQELAAKRKLPINNMVEILRGICSAVEAAHRRSIVHRDLKPDNIFLAEQEEGIVPKVLDFGVAALLDPEEATLTLAGARAVGELAGTPGYIAPERLRGERCGRGADIWSIGVVAYEMLTGRHPFAGTTPSFTPIAVHIPSAPPEWQKFFVRALADRPHERPQSPQLFFLEFVDAFRVAADAATPN